MNYTYRYFWRFIFGVFFVLCQLGTYTNPSKKSVDSFQFMIDKYGFFIYMLLFIVNSQQQ